jgi:hypothetical protein
MSSTPNKPRIAASYQPPDVGQRVKNTLGITSDTISLKNECGQSIYYAVASDLNATVEAKVNGSLNVGAGGGGISGGKEFMFAQKATKQLGVLKHEASSTLSVSGKKMYLTIARLSGTGKEYVILFRDREIAKLATYTISKEKLEEEIGRMSSWK